MKPTTICLIRLLLVAAILTVTADPSMAQRRRRGTELDLLRSESVLQEIGVDVDVINQIDQLRRNTMTTRAAFEEFKDELREAETDEQRTAIREKIQAAVKNGGQQFQQQALQLLTKEQTQQLRRVYVQNYGLFALADDRVAGDLQLADDQREKISALLQERRTLESNDDLSTDDRDQQLKSSEEQLLAVLSAEQQQTWRQQSEPDTTAASEEREVADSDRANTEDSSSATAPTETMEVDGDIVASFAPRTTRPGRETERFSFNFRHVPWERVLQMFADGTGLTLDMQRVPPGTLSHLDQREYSADQALDIINGYLIRKGFGLVAKDGFLVVVNLDEQLDQSLVPEVSLEELRQTGDRQTVGNHQLVTVRIPVAGLDTGRTAQEVEALLGPWGSMIALTQSEILMVTDIGANLRRIVGLLDTASRPDEMVFIAYHLKNIDVEEAEPLLLTQFGMRLGATNVSSAAESRRYRESRSRDGRSPTPPATPAASEDQLQVASDLRTNSLLVTGTPAQHQLVRIILDAIDVSEAPDGTALSRTGRRGRYLSVYDVSSADAREVTKTLDAIMPGIVVNEDGNNGKIHIMASEKEHEEVEQLIRQLDGAGGRQSVAVIPLIKMDPLMAAATLRSLFVSEGDEAPTLETDVYGRRLIVRGSPEQVAQIKAVLAQLGEDGTGMRPVSQDSLRRRYSLQGRSPDEFLRILQQTWKNSEPNPIRVVVPSRSGPVRERRTSDGVVDPSAAVPAEQETQSSRTPPEQPGAAQIRTGYVAVDLQDDQADESTPAGDDEVLITVLGDDLLLTSDDPEALDRLEELLDSLQQTLPYRARWTVFYLQSADATETADMLSQIFPSSSVASTVASSGGSLLGSITSSFSGIGSSLADATGLSGLGESPQTLRIIPDVRSNSLLISGPDALLQDVWAMLNVLDSNEIPESFRDMQQRTIELLFADVDNVAAILREVYKPLLEARDSSRQQPRNPFAAMLGASSNDEDSRVVRMTLGVDRQTSSLIISSSQEIFDDVKELVETLDKKAMSANRRIQVVRLRSADPAMVQESLSSLFPRVTSSASTSRPGAAAGTAASGEDTERQQRDSEDRQRAEAFRRWRERSERARQADPGDGQGTPRANGGRSGRRDRQRGR